MDTVLIVAASALLYIVAYHTYGKWLSRKLFEIDPSRETPSVVHNDGKDYVPSSRSMVFGHHFTSIAGTGPIVGPAIAVVWGWVPALLWILFGSIFIGAVHDFASLVMSLRNQGRTIGDYCGDIINKRVRILFLLIIMFVLWIVIAIFGLVIAVVFAKFPQSVLPVWLQIPISITLGWYVYKKSGNPLIGSIVSVAVIYGLIWLCSANEALQIKPAMLPGFISPIGFWTILLLVYCFVASVLPVHVLLQPRDYINSHQLLLAMGLLVLGVLVARPELTSVAPGFRMNVDGAPMLFPFLFITVACGACSGFHCLVSSGVSSKQLKSEGDAQYVGYGAMLLEGMLAVIIIVACCAGLGMGFTNGTGDALTGAAAWNAKYTNWGASNGLGNVMVAVVAGGGNLVNSLGIPHSFAMGILGVFIASFAATTLDSATRLQRYVIAELGSTVNVPALKNAYVATTIAVVSGLFLAMFDVFNAPTFSEGLKKGGQGAMVLWPLFGACNQLLAGLALLVATVWLYRKRKPALITGVPMVFMLLVTGWGLVEQIGEFANAEKPNIMLCGIGLVILLLECWMIAEAFFFTWSLRRTKAAGGEIPELFESA